MSYTSFTSLKLLLQSVTKTIIFEFHNKKWWTVTLEKEPEWAADRMRQWFVWVFLLIFYQSGFNSYTGTACWCYKIVSSRDMDDRSWWNNQTSTVQRPPGWKKEHHRGRKGGTGQHVNKNWTLFISSFLWEMGDLLCALFLSWSNLRSS